MKTFIRILILVFFLQSSAIFGQKSSIYTNALKDYNHAIALYHDKDYVAAQNLLLKAKEQFSENSEYKAICDYYIAFSSLHLNDRNGGQLMNDFIHNYPTSNKRNDAYREVSAFYYDYGKYNDALKWFKYVDTKSLTHKQEEDYNFKYGYALFQAKSYKQAKNYFAVLLDSPKYGEQAKYYYGFMAYQEDDFNNADKYLSEVAQNEQLGKDVPYFQATIKFKLGKFQEAINIAEPYLEKATPKQKSEVSKILGESYFNLQKYEEAIPHLKNYRGKRNKWINTDYYQLGYAYYQQKNYGEAITWFNKIIGAKGLVGQNTSYHIAECYLKTGKKQEALNAFKSASEMDFDNNIKKNAWLNYAKLSYEIGNPYKSVPDVLTEYLNKYPKSNAKDTINELLISSYVTSKDYVGAIKLLKNKNDNKAKEIYQKVTFYRGVQLYNDANFNEAESLFTESLQKKIDPKFTARATYWNANTKYSTNDFTNAKAEFTTFLDLENASEIAEFSNANYHLGYTNFKLKDYSSAISAFNNYLNANTQDIDKKNDTYLRLGDCYFVTRDYWKGMQAYNTAIENNAKDLDYAHFQKAISYGFVGKNKEKINDLQAFLTQHKTSKLRDEAYFNLGDALKKDGQDNNAIQAYQQIITKHKRSDLVPKALLKQGSIHFNNQNGEEALVKYKIIVRDYPHTAEARQAVNNAKQIYINQGKVDEYAAWVQNVDFVEVTDTDLDNSMFEAADLQFQQNNLPKAKQGFKKYLTRFPYGLHAKQAHFTLAEMFYTEQKFENTKVHYQFLIEQEPNEYTEQALAKLSQVYIKEKKWQNALPILSRLELEAKTEQNIIYAQSNLMKGNYQLENYNDAVAYAEKILTHTNIDNRVKNDAQIIIARSAIKTNNLEKARTAYQQVGLTAQGKLKAEALYYDAYFLHQDKDYSNSNLKVQEISRDYSAYKVWSVKSLVIMAKNFYGLDDAYQATHILEAVIKTFKDQEEHDDAVADAEATLQKIKTEQAKTNSSIVPE